jgi:hypothetical protein
MIVNNIDSGTPPVFVIPTVGGPDLTAITNKSIVIAQLHDANMTLGSLGYSSNYAMCNVWDVFTHGFHIYCNTDIMVPHNPELRVAVINP